MEKWFRALLGNEIVIYIFFGVLNTVLSFIGYALFLYLGLGLVLSNTLATILAILFAYVTNKVWVFGSLNFELDTVFKEFFKFLSARFVTYIVDTVLLVALVGVLLVDSLVAKVVTSFIVIVLNYLLSKKMVFK